MGVGSVVDGVLFVFFLSIAAAFPILDSQVFLPQHLFPTFMVELKNSYTQLSGDYLIGEKPHFYVGIVWVQLLLIFPLSLACLYAMAARKPWFNSTCLMLGSASLTAMGAILGELILSNRAADGVLMLYSPFLGLSALTVLRGFFPHTKNGHLLHTKKRA